MAEPMKEAELYKILDGFIVYFSSRKLLVDATNPESAIQEGK